MLSKFKMYKGLKQEITKKRPSDQAELHSKCYFSPFQHSQPIKNLAFLCIFSDWCSGHHVGVCKYSNLCFSLKKTKTGAPEQKLEVVFY